MRYAFDKYETIIVGIACSILLFTGIGFYVVGHTSSAPTHLVYDGLSFTAGESIHSAIAAVQAKGMTISWILDPRSNDRVLQHQKVLKGQLLYGGFPGPAEVDFLFKYNHLVSADAIFGSSHSFNDFAATLDTVMGYMGGKACKVKVTVPDNSAEAHLSSHGYLISFRCGNRGFMVLGNAHVDPTTIMVLGTPSR